MSVHPVLRIPEPVLAQPCVPVTQVGAGERALADALFATMAVSPGCVGLAANQIGVSVAAFVINVTGHPKTDVSHGAFMLFNPVLVAHNTPHLAREGCMSVPDLTGDVVRAFEITVRGLDIDGRPREITTNAFEARAIQHELDHLAGLVFLDRVASPAAVHPRKRYR
ncbi:MAG: peptide deformylase [Acidimicrobiia bacterium]